MVASESFARSDPILGEVQPVELGLGIGRESGDLVAAQVKSLKSRGNEIYNGYMI